MTIYSQLEFDHESGLVYREKRIKVTLTTEELFEELHHLVVEANKATANIAMLQDIIDDLRETNHKLVDALSDTEKILTDNNCMVSLRIEIAELLNGKIDKLFE